MVDRDKLLTGLTHITVDTKSAMCRCCEYQDSCKNDTCIYIRAAQSAVIGLQVEVNVKDGEIFVLREWVKRLGECPDGQR